MEDRDSTLIDAYIPCADETEQTDVRVPGDRIASDLGQLPDKGAPTVLYCRSGSMSTTAARALAEMGYTNVMELDDGFNAWEAAGHALSSHPGSSALSPQESAGSPRILFEQEVIDLGDVALGVMYTVEFDYRNAGDAPLTVEGTRVQTRAGC